ncbi:hypothetical protein [Castellaniella caeni]|uniref:hypothetical protein n=1 Tax=Castellaniella caeni TaxID=266123 RepID=UPI0011AF4EA7|nr:hypothetical protein [Castellaniella caeni]
MVDRQWLRYGAAIGMAAVAAVVSGCTAVAAGQLAQAGYDVAKTSISNSMGSADAKHAREVLNALNVGQDVAPVLEQMAVPPKEKSGNLQGFVCYQYAGVYSVTEDAVLVSRDGKVVFFGNSTCRAEMQAANFVAGGKYAVSLPDTVKPAVSPASASPDQPPAAPTGD